MGTRGEERLKAITDAATEVVAERGYYGMTIQEVSDRVGITQAGLLKYVKNKNGLLMLVLRRYEDSSEAGDYIQSKLALTPEQRELSPLLMPEYYRTIAEDTMKPPATHTAVSGAARRSHRSQSPGARVLRPAWRTAARADRQLSVEAAARI
mgnify:CR=1 FL=1